MSWATVRTLAFVIFALLGAVCGADEPVESRLIGPNDAEFVTLETPEALGECTVDEDCEQSCTHACAPLPTGPVTCPTIPPAEPDRIATAHCTCAEQVCAWFE